MTRRGAIIGAMLLAGGKLMAQGTTSNTLTWKQPEPANLQFTFGDAGGFKALVVAFSDGSKVTLTEADLKRELTHQQEAK